jgi:hypothetical protein
MRKKSWCKRWIKYEKKEDERMKNDRRAEEDLEMEKKLKDYIN